MNSIRLTPRERMIVNMVLSGDGPTGIAKALNLSKNTVKHQLHTVYVKFGIAGSKAGKLVRLFMAARKMEVPQ